MKRILSLQNKKKSASNFCQNNSRCGGWHPHDGHVEGIASELLDEREELLLLHQGGLGLELVQRAQIKYDCFIEISNGIDFNDLLQTFDGLKGKSGEMMKKKNTFGKEPNEPAEVCM